MRLRELGALEGTGAQGLLGKEAAEPPGGAEASVFASCASSWLPGSHVHILGLSLVCGLRISGEWLGLWRVATGKPLNWDGMFQSLIYTAFYNASAVSC